MLHPICAAHRMVPAALIFALGAGTAGAQTLNAIYESGPRASQINLVVLSEGYTAAELGTKFPGDAVRVIDAILGHEPYRTYRNFFNAYTIAVASAQSGSDHPSQGIYRNTYFDSTYDSFGIERLLTLSAAGEGRAGALLATRIPEYDLSVVLVNDNLYGGSGGFYPVISSSSDSTQVAIHEIGHSFVGLTDEYEDPYPAYTPVESINATMRTDRELVAWKHWINPNTPLPTPETPLYATAVGLFEGANYRSAGWYRPTLDSLMRSWHDDFGPVNNEAFVLRFYSLVAPVSGALPAPGMVNVESLALRSFTLMLHEPAFGTPDHVSWYVDGIARTGNVTETTLVRRRATWRYLDTGIAPPAGWTGGGFDDTGWLSGDGEFGYGDGDEQTAVRFGASTSNRHITTWFRRKFDVPAAADYSGLHMELRRDDGAAVYLNGVEVYRSNLASGPLTPARRAFEDIAGDAENGWYDVLLPASRLVNGPNTVAVEVHQSGPASNDLSFDLALHGKKTGSGLPAGGASFTLDPASLPDGLHTLRAVVSDATGFVRQDPADLSRSALEWTLNVSIPGRDSDNDGLPDAWETGQFGNLSQDAAGDPDHDGQSNGAEYAAGTLPLSGVSHFFLTASSGAGNAITLRWPSAAGRTYRIMESSTLTSWSLHSTVPAPPGAEASAIVTPADGAFRGYYRVETTAP